MDFTQVRGFVVGISFGLPRSISSVTCFELPWPRTPPLWQRVFFLVNCFVLRRLLASVRGGVVQTFQ